MAKKILIGFGAFIFILIIVLVIIATRGEAPGPAPLTFPKEPVTLTYWRLFDDQDVFENILEMYASYHPNVTIEYVEKDYQFYEEDLLNALAAGTGPDIFMLRHDWLPKHLDKLSPAPEGLSFVAQKRGGLKKDLPTQFKEVFVDVASSELVQNSQVYGVPLWMDSLALYYNTSLFEEEGIYTPPATWDELIETSKKLTKKDQKGNITQAGVALGTDKNIAKAKDILSLLMVQNNTQMTTADKKTATFNLSIKKTTGEIVYPGTLALDFYTSFARPTKETYAWNSNFPDSIQAFGEGKVAMILHYSYWISLLKKMYPKLRFETAPIPQIKGVTESVNYAFYWAEVVSKDAQYPQVAWDFLKFITSSECVREYSYTTKRPYARRDFAKEAVGGGGISTFSEQNLTAVSWYQGGEPQKIDEIFQIMIEGVVEKGQPLQAAIDSAAASTTNILQQAEPLIEKEKVEP